MVQSQSVPLSPSVFILNHIHEQHCTAFEKILLFESKTRLHNVMSHTPLLLPRNLFFYICSTELYQIYMHSTRYCQKHSLLRARASQGCNKDHVFWPLYVTDVSGQDLCMPNVCPPLVVDKNQRWMIFVLKTDLYQFVYCYKRTVLRVKWVYCVVSFHYFTPTD